MQAVSPAKETLRWPAQVKYIIGNEACERFSFYGMRNILTAFLVDYLLLSSPLAERAPHAKEIFHLFAMAVYFTPLFGGYLADRHWGKYRTILWLSLVYSAGHALLAIFDDEPKGFYLGLALVAIGSGGIKPCVAAFVGDQFTASQKSLLPKIFAAYYWSVNIGSFTASLFIPKLLRYYGPSVAFGVPGVLMLTATVVFWLGRKHYYEIPPAPHDPHSFLRVVRSAWVAPSPAGPEGAWLDRARGVHPPEAIEGAKAVVGVLKIFAFIPFFWMLFDQKASAWVLQAKTMVLEVGPVTFEPSQLQIVNPLLMMMLLPLTTGLLYPALAKTRWALTPLRRMPLGMFVSGLAFVCVAAIQHYLDNGIKLSVLWQFAPYVLLTLGEVLVSVTGLEFAYAQAPRKMKGTIMSFFYLANSIGNLLVIIVAGLNVFTGAASFLFYAALVGLSGIGMLLVARRHVNVEFFREA
ncbi:MAG TPA: MFS transporter [Polyangiaceae bacterium]|jgi:POT family proton-dependent oligopeptide transporter|nr:MFS transporter [Polyangiaceae bacterium]